MDDHINNFAIRQHAAVSQMPLTRESAHQWGRGVALAIEAARKRQQEWNGSAAGHDRESITVRLAGDHPAAQILIDRFKQDEPVLLRLNGIVQGARVSRHTWNFAPAGGVSHCFELSPADVPGVPAMDLPSILDEESEEEPLPAINGSMLGQLQWCTPKLKECDECTDAGRCSRIGQCLRYRCAFGQVDKP